MKHKYWLEAVLLCGVMQSAPAQSILKNKDEKELSLLLNEVVVTGTGTEHYLKDAPVQTEVLYKKAVELADLKGDETVLDLYCGIGTKAGIRRGDCARSHCGREEKRGAKRYHERSLCRRRGGGGHPRAVSGGGHCGRCGCG